MISGNKTTFSEIYIYIFLHLSLLPGSCHKKGKKSTFKNITMLCYFISCFNHALINLSRMSILIKEEYKMSFLTAILLIK